MNKFRSQLKKFGMEKEFSDWKEKILLEPREFRIGDKVRIVGSGNRYHWTRDESEGVITGLYGTIATIDFYKLTGGSEPCGTYRIGQKFIKII